MITRSLTRVSCKTIMHAAYSQTLEWRQFCRAASLFYAVFFYCLLSASSFVLSVKNASFLLTFQKKRFSVLMRIAKPFFLHSLRHKLKVQNRHKAKIGFLTFPSPRQPAGSDTGIVCYDLSTLQAGLGRISHSLLFHCLFGIRRHRTALLWHDKSAAPVTPQKIFSKAYHNRSALPCDQQKHRLGVFVMLRLLCKQFGTKAFSPFRVLRNPLRHFSLTAMPAQAAALCARKLQPFIALKMPLFDVTQNQSAWHLLEFLFNGKAYAHRCDPPRRGACRCNGR